MKQVTFSTPMAPHGVGDTRLLPDDIAARLDREGALSTMTDWPPVDQASSGPQRPVRPMLRPNRAAPRDQRKVR